MSRWQQIKARDWGEIRESWLNHVPPLTNQCAHPGLVVESIIGSGISDGSLRADELNAFPDHLHEAVLWEALFLMHKGGHAIGAAQATLQTGRVSWSQFNAYHGGFLVSRAVMAFLGIATPRPNGLPLLADLFPPRGSSSSKPTLPSKHGAAGRGGAPQHFALWRAKGAIEQAQFWELFIRTVRMTKGAAWDQKIADSLLAISPEKYSRRRNPFLYSVSYWPFADLIRPLADLKVVERRPNFPTDYLDDDTPQFLWIATLFVFHLGLSLLRDLAKDVPLLERELAGFRSGYWPSAAANYELLFGAI